MEKGGRKATQSSISIHYRYRGMEVSQQQALHAMSRRQTLERVDYGTLDHSHVLWPVCDELVQLHMTYALSFCKVT